MRFFGLDAGQHVDHKVAYLQRQAVILMRHGAAFSGKAGLAKQGI